jgi:hypothetical protein
MRLRYFTTALAAAMAWAGAASAEPVQYTVIESDATIPFGSRINQLDRPTRDTVLVRTGANHWYRIQLNENCARGSMIGSPVRLETYGQGSPIDRFTWVRLEDRSCAIQSLDRVELVSD